VVVPAHVFGVPVAWWFVGVRTSSLMMKGLLKVGQHL
jgi:hypothetical protein